MYCATFSPAEREERRGGGNTKGCGGRDLKVGVPYPEGRRPVLSLMLLVSLPAAGALPRLFPTPPAGKPRAARVSPAHVGTGPVSRASGPCSRPLRSPPGPPPRVPAAPLPSPVPASHPPPASPGRRRPAR